MHGQTMPVASRVAAQTMAKKLGPQSRLSRLRERLARSSRVFLLGLVVACGVEVLVDWNSTLFEINVLRNRMRDRGLSYVAILSKACASPMRAGDAATLGRLSSGVFDDEEVLAVRFFDADGRPLHDRVAEEGGARFVAARRAPLLAYYEHQMIRDVRGILKDPDGQAKRMAESRWRDFPQMWNDAMAKLVARFAAPPAKRSVGTLSMYQDRLRTPDRQRDTAVTYAFATIVDDDARQVGAVMVVFSMDRTNDAITMKYLKGAGMVAFFVALIIVQNVTGRRDKLRLLELEARAAKARAALDAASPDAAVAGGGAALTGAIHRAEGRVDGMLWDAAPIGGEPGGVLAFAIDPEGEGLDAASVALAVREAFHARRAAGVDVALDEELAAIGEIVRRIPLAERASVLLLRLRGGRFEFVASAAAAIRVLQGEKVARATEVARDERAPFGELTQGEGTLAQGETVVAMLGAASPDQVAGCVAKGSPGPVGARVAKAASEAPGRTPGADTLVLAGALAT